MLSARGDDDNTAMMSVATELLAVVKVHSIVTQIRVAFVSNCQIYTVYIPPVDGRRSPFANCNVQSLRFLHQM